MTKPLEDTLIKRQSTHGHFTDHAACSQDLKAVICKHLIRRDEAGRVPLTHCQIESLEMIAHKIGRIIAGQAEFADHWDDIAGYAKIANYKAPS